MAWITRAELGMIASVDRHRAPEAWEGTTWTPTLRSVFGIRWRRPEATGGGPVRASPPSSPSTAFAGFLTETLGNAAKACNDGAIAFVCMDWRHMGELLTAGEAVFSELKNLCIWNKNNGGMGTFYRSKHELVFVFKVGTAPHTNSFGLGDTGRYRTNVWDYAGVNTLKPGRMDELAMHPTVKPVALVADAIRDCSKRGEIVLDPFAGSGTTLIGTEKTGRCARVIEFDPAYCEASCAGSSI